MKKYVSTVYLFPARKKVKSRRKTAPLFFKGHYLFPAGAGQSEKKFCYALYFKSDCMVHRTAEMPDEWLLAGLREPSEDGGHGHGHR